MSAETNISGNVEGPGLSGTFTGEIHIASKIEVDELAAKLIEKYGPRHAEMAVTMGTQQRLVAFETYVERCFERIERRFNAEEDERHQRQGVLDGRLDRIDAAASRSLWTSAAALLAAGAAWIRARTQ